MSLLKNYRNAIVRGELKPDPVQDEAVGKLRLLSDVLKSYRPGSGWFGTRRPPRGLYIWGDVGRGKSMLMDLFYEDARPSSKRRVHFNAFMVDVHARIHAERQRGQSSDPIPPVARAVAADAALLCFDEFQVTDVADAMILGRLFGQLFERGVVVVATSNTEPRDLYQGGLNRQLFMPFIDLLASKLDIFALNGPIDYRLHRMGGLKVYLTPLGPEADAAMDRAWVQLTHEPKPAAATLTVLGRQLSVPAAARGVCRFTFSQLCEQPLAAADYLAIAQTFHTVMIDHIPEMTPAQRNEARRFIVLIDTLYDEAVKLICSAAVPPDALYRQGDGADSFRRTASRLTEMQSEDYLRRGHGVHGLVPAAASD